MKSFFTNVLTIAVLAGIGIAVGAAYGFTRPVEAQVEYKDKVVLVTQPENIAPVLERIAKCESGGSQFKNGQVVINLNKNGTYDQGKYQINSIHNADATKHGFNLSTEEGNEGYAKYMYLNLGTGDWASSQTCWKQ